MGISSSGLVKFYLIEENIFFVIVFEIFEKI